MARRVLRHNPSNAVDVMNISDYEPSDVLSKMVSNAAKVKGGIKIPCGSAMITLGRVSKGDDGGDVRHWRLDHPDHGLIAGGHIEKEGGSYHEREAFVHPNHQRKGIYSTVLKNLRLVLGPVVPDTMQTTANQRRWAKYGNPRGARRRNPFNATKPAEWDKMSKSLRRRWNRTHWRPDQWKCDLALKKEATRIRHRQEGRGQGLLDLVGRAVKTNPSPRRKARRIPVPFKGKERISGRGLRAAFKKAFPGVNPYPYEHSARLIDPRRMNKASFRRKNVKGGTIGLIMGKPLFGRQVMTLQAVRFRSAHFTPAQAKAWLKRHKMRPIMFEPATSSRRESWVGESKRLKRSRAARRRTRTSRRRYA